MKPDIFKQENLDVLKNTFTFPSWFFPLAFSFSFFTKHSLKIFRYNRAVIGFVRCRFSLNDAIGLILVLPSSS